MDFPAVYLPLPMEAVPLSTPRHSVAVCTTRLPLSPHCNPFSAHGIRQPRCFPPQSVHFFSLFCRSGFKEQRAACCSGRRLSGLTPHPPHPRKAGYVCTQRYGPAGPMHRAAGSSAASYAARNTTLGVRPRTRTGLHGNRVVITMPLESALSPQAQAKPGFPPAPTRNWAYQAGTRGFIGVPFRGFLAPPSETDDLTRILRRRLAPYSISQI